MTSSESLAPGAIIAEKYELVRRLGGGGMGVVFEARHLVIGRRFAIKLLHPDLAKNPKMQARFRREAEAAGRIESEHVVGVVDFGVADDRAFIVMELLEGEDLRALLGRVGRLELGRAAEIVRQACLGVAAGHARAVTHRDLKPENLFVSRRSDGKEIVRVLDFGVAHLEQAEGTALTTEEGVLIGTVMYMAPEQVRGDRPVDRRVDVYALGAILYELLSGKPPHSGKRPHNVLYSILHEQPKPLTELVPSVPERMLRVVDRALAKDADARPQSAEELARLLEPFCEQLLAPQATVVAHSADNDEGSVALQRTEPVTTRSQPARPGWWRVAGIAVLLAVAGTALLVGLSRRSTTQAPSTDPSVATPAAAPPAPIQRPSSAQSSSPPGADASAALPKGAPPPRTSARAPASPLPPADTPRSEKKILLDRDNPYQ